jgi:uncharacterized membrane protein
VKLFSLLLVLLSLVAVILSPSALAANDSSTGYYRAKVLAEFAPTPQDPQSMLRVQFINGPDSGSEATVPSTGLNSTSDISLPSYKKGDIVVISSTVFNSSRPQYSVVDHFRLINVAILLGVVVLLAVIFAGWRGLGSLIGLGISLSVIVGFIIPNILDGRSPYPVTLAGCFAIAALGIFISHGFSRRTTIALISTYITLVIAAGLSILGVWAASLNGIATEDASYLHQQLPFLNIQGVLLAGIMIGVLGVLDDVTVGQAAAVDELRRANASLTWQELYIRGLRVGREHISSLINTLVLAYAGSSFVYIVYVAGVLNLPIWLSLNSELVTEEIVRSLIGSIALILGIPIATALSAYFLTHGPGLNNGQNMKKRVRQ